MKAYADINNAQTTPIKDLIKRHQRTILLLAASVIVVSGLVYAYNTGNSAATLTGTNDIGQLAKGCTSYQCIGNVQWTTNPLTGAKECRTC